VSRAQDSKGGRRKVLFGTNCPMIFHQQALEHLDALELDDETRRLFLGGNAERLLKLTARAAA
jgi:predicted TIM-barrel fold metal-dependent hydrolase